jgi:GT2 family glycosyltransferase
VTDAGRRASRSGGPDHLIAVPGQASRGARLDGWKSITDRLQSRLQRRRDTIAYREWVKRYATLTEADRVAIRSRISRLADRPLVSIVMPVYDTGEAWLRRAIESVLGQLYPRWELCVADDCSSRPHVRAILQEYAARDSRIKLVFREQNGHISAASNSALALATGEFVALLDHDDELAEHALYAVVEELNRHPSADLLYSDEDKIDERGRRYEPFFKPDWNPDLFYSLNLVTHLAVYRRSVLEAVNGFRVGVEGSQDYDLTLRVIEHIPPTSIRHIPQVLYHWRAIPGSVALAPKEKDYAHEAARLAIRAHFERRQVPVQVCAASATPSLHRVVYPMPAPPPLVSLVLSGTGRPAVLRRSVASLLSRTDYAPFELLIGGAAAEEIARALHGVGPDRRIRILDQPGGAPAVAASRAIACAAGEIVGLLGLVEPMEPGWLGEMVRHASRPDIGAVGAKLYDDAGGIAHAGIVLGGTGTASGIHRGVLKAQAQASARLVSVQNYTAVSGACLVVRKEILELAGGLDTEHLPSVHFDVDLCLRLNEAGYRTLWTPYAQLRWLDAPEAGPADIDASEHGTTAREWRYMLSRWGGVLRCDPNYNPNLSLASEPGGLAAPPRWLAPWASAAPTQAETSVAVPVIPPGRP